MSLMKDGLHLPKAISIMCLSFLSKNQVMAIQTPRDTHAPGPQLEPPCWLHWPWRAGCRPWVLPVGAEESKRHRLPHVVYSQLCVPTLPFTQCARDKAPFTGGQEVEAQF